jgi:hypothetical protein
MPLMSLSSPLYAAAVSSSQRCHWTMVRFFQMSTKLAFQRAALWRLSAGLCTQHESATSKEGPLRCPAASPRPVQYPKITGFFQAIPLDMYFVRRSRKRTLFHSIGDSWNAMMFVMKHVPEGEPMLVNKWSVFDPSTLLSSGSMTQLSPEAIAVMTRVQAQDPVLCRQKR